MNSKEHFFLLNQLFQLSQTNQCGGSMWKSHCDCKHELSLRDAELGILNWPLSRISNLALQTLQPCKQKDKYGEAKD